MLKARNVGEEEIISNMNNSFTNITIYIKLKPTKVDSKANPESTINTFQNHESAQRIKLANFHSKSSLKFNRVSELDIKKKNLKFVFQKSYQKR